MAYIWGISSVAQRSGIRVPYSPFARDINRFLRFKKDHEPVSTSQKGVTFISGENSRGLLTEKLKDFTCGGNFP